MSLPPPDSIPRGWYPDPGGERQWRVWTGGHWSEMTRPYGEPVVRAAVAQPLALIGALRRVERYGVVAAFAGLGLVVSVLAHWPGTHYPANMTVASALLSIGVALLALGSVVFSFAVRELEGRWSLEAVLPGANVIMVWSLVTRRLTGRRFWLRDAFAVVVMILFVAQAHADPLLGMLPAIVAWDLTVSTEALLTRLSGASMAPSAGS